MMVCIQLFWEFAKIGLICVGGGYASMPLIQAAVVDSQHWLTLSEFIDIFTISQMTPGPIGINAATFAGSVVLAWQTPPPMPFTCSSLTYSTAS